MGSPIRGISSLMTSAPSSARLATECGVKIYMVQLIQRMPFKASGLTNSLPTSKTFLQYSSKGAFISSSSSLLLGPSSSSRLQTFIFWRSLSSI